LDDSTLVTALYYADGCNTDMGFDGLLSCQVIRYTEGALFQA
jgi:hypothetical protein